MPQITKIEPQKKVPNRYNIFLDGKYSFSLSQDSLIEFKLKVNSVLAEEKIQEIVNFEQYDKIFQMILAFISYRLRSKNEIDRRLEQYLSKIELDEEFLTKIKEKVITRLRELNLYNDSDFATLYVENSKNSRVPLGANKIKEFLQKRGVERAIIDDLLNNYFKYEIEGVKIEYQKKLKKTKKDTSYKAKAKVAKFLAGKGYSWDAINAVVDSNFQL